MNFNKIYLTLVVLVMALTGCSSGADKKEITPKSTEFTSGELARYVEFVNEPCELTYTEQDGTIPSQTMRLKTTMKLTKAGLENVDYHDISFTSLLAVACVNLVDETGTKIQDLDISDEGKLALKKLLVGKEGDTAEIIFESEFHNSDDAPNWYKSTTGFSPYLSADIRVESSASSTSTSNETSEVQEPGTVENSNDPEVILPSNLKGKVEVVSVEKGIGSFGYPQVTVTFKLLQKVNTAPLCSAGGQMWIIGGSGVVPWQG